jgi:hypothetical protein
MKNSARSFLRIFFILVIVFTVIGFKTQSLLAQRHLTPDEVIKKITDIANAIPEIRVTDSLGNCKGVKNVDNNIDLDYFQHYTLFQLSDNDTTLLPLTPPIGLYFIEIKSSFFSRSSVNVIFDKNVQNEIGYYQSKLNQYKVTDTVFYGAYGSYSKPYKVVKGFKKESESTLKEYCKELNEALNGFHQLADNFKSLSLRLQTLKNNLTDFNKKISDSRLDDQQLFKSIDDTLNKINDKLVKPLTNKYKNITITFDNVEKISNEIKQIDESVTLINIGFDTYNKEGKLSALDIIKSEADKVGAANDRILAAGGITFTGGKLETVGIKAPIAVFPPGIFGNPGNQDGYAAVLPESIFDKVKGFFLAIAPWLFVLLVIGGGIVYLLTPFWKEAVTKGHSWIKYAVIGYFLLLVSSGAITLLKNILGVP